MSCVKCGISTQLILGNSIMLRNYCLFFSLSVAVLQGSLAQAKPAASTDLSTAMRELAEHVNETSISNADQIKQQTEIIRKNIDQIGQTSALLISLPEVSTGLRLSSGRRPNVIIPAPGRTSNPTNS